MKDYPSIPRSTGQSFKEIKDCFIFDKLDGSNLRFEWNKKNGWHKFGTRNRLFNEKDEVFGVAVKLFNEKLSEPITKIAVDQKWESTVIFAEFWGKNSFAGMHDSNDEKYLTLFDCAPYKKGILGPKFFLKLFGEFDFCCPCLGQRDWTKDFCEEVRQNLVEGVTFEGVVGKHGEGHHLVMTKAKTQNWIDKVKALYSPEQAEKLINS